MSLVVYEWDSTQKISCSDCLPADVIIGVTPGIVAQSLCPIQPVVSPETTASDDFPYGTILGQVINYSEQLRHGRYFYRYALRFDDTQLVVGTTITSSTIRFVICEGGLTTWIREQAGNEIKLEKILGTQLNPDRYRLTSQHGCKFEFDMASIQISADGGNAAHLGTDGGIYVAAGGVPSIVSSDLGNLIDIGSDGGAHLECADIAGCTNVVSDGLPVIVTNPAPGSYGVGVKVSSVGGNGTVIAGDGGIWSPNAAMIGSDSVVVNVGAGTSGGNRVVHTALDGNVDSFADGIDQIRTSIPGQPHQGVGAGFALNSISLAGEVLTVLSAPEHTALYATKGMEQPFGGPYNINPVDEYVRPVFNSPLSITNPSAHRSMLVGLYVHMQSTFILESVTAQRRVEAATNGGAWVVQTAVNMAIAIPSGRMNFGFVDNYLIWATIAPGATYTVDLRLRVAVTLPGVGLNSWTDLGVMAHLFGVTQ